MNRDTLPSSLMHNNKNDKNTKFNMNTRSFKRYIRVNSRFDEVSNNQLAIKLIIIICYVST